VGSSRLELNGAALIDPCMAVIMKGRRCPTRLNNIVATISVTSSPISENMMATINVKRERVCQFSVAITFSASDHCFVTL
jgi:hypothetical protein